MRQSGPGARQIAAGRRPGNRCNSPHGGRSLCRAGGGPGRLEPRSRPQRQTQTGTQQPKRNGRPDRQSRPQCQTARQPSGRGAQRQSCARAASGPSGGMLGTAPGHPRPGGVRPPSPSVRLRCRGVGCLNERGPTSPRALIFRPTVPPRLPVPRSTRIRFHARRSLPTWPAQFPIACRRRPLQQRCGRRRFLPPLGRPQRARLV